MIVFSKQLPHLKRARLYATTLLLVLPLMQNPVWAQEESSFTVAVERVLNRYLIPSYTAFNTAAVAQVQAMNKLCAQPSMVHLHRARTQMAALLHAWSRVEAIRFGPVRINNRYEQIFFWPDVRGRGLRQVQKLLSSADPQALQPNRFAQKSVAVQGLVALEYVLFASGSEELVQETEYRCAYGATIAERIATNSRMIADAWQGAYGQQLLNLDNSTPPEELPYQTSGEVVQAFVQAAAEQLHAVYTFKLLAALGNTQQQPRLQRAPFWRSGLTLNSILANIEGVRALLISGIVPLLPELHDELNLYLMTDLNTVSSAITALQQQKTNWLNLNNEDPEAYKNLAAMLTALENASIYLKSDYPAALGFISGFNAFDGD